MGPAGFTFRETIKRWARAFEEKALCAWFVASDPRTPFLAKILAFLVAACAFSPIDLVPDFVPVPGHVDDLVLIMIGVVLVLKSIPAEVLESAEVMATQVRSRPKSPFGASMLASVWTMGVAGFALLVMKPFCESYLKGMR